MSTEASKDSMIKGKEKKMETSDIMLSKQDSFEEL
jgi:hypothetical protein